MPIEEIKKFSNEINSKIYFDHDLKKSNWFNIGGKTKVYFKPESLSDLIQFLKKIWFKRKNLYTWSWVKYFSQMMTLLMVLLLNQEKVFLIFHYYLNDIIVAGSACTDKKLSEFALNNGIGGLEFLACIPGTVGGGLRMNAGCFNREFKDILLSIQAIDKKGRVITIQQLMK